MNEQFSTFRAIAGNPECRPVTFFLKDNFFQLNNVLRSFLAKKSRQKLAHIVIKQGYFFAPIFKAGKKELLLSK